MKCLLVVELFSKVVSVDVVVATHTSVVGWSTRFVARAVALAIP